MPRRFLRRHALGFREENLVRDSLVPPHSDAVDQGHHPRLCQFLLQYDRLVLVRLPSRFGRRRSGPAMLNQSVITDGPVPQTPPAIHLPRGGCRVVPVRTEPERHRGDRRRFIREGLRARLNVDGPAGGAVRIRNEGLAALRPGGGVFKSRRRRHGRDRREWTSTRRAVSVPTSVCFAVGVAEGTARDSNAGWRGGRGDTAPIALVLSQAQCNRFQHIAHHGNVPVDRQGKELVPPPGQVDE
mmetsp:Transcript_21974/g.64977  ORF Transcript_21974/g.64977 Transcript_21974/m.64977 type:complete len:242 (+) Transcript_21974:1119-1844(+)